MNPLRHSVKIIFVVRSLLEATAFGSRVGAGVLFATLLVQAMLSDLHAARASFDAPVLLTRADDFTSPDNHGNSATLYVWRQLEYPTHAIGARELSPGGPLGPVATVAEVDDAKARFGGIAAAMRVDGSALIVWTKQFRSPARFQVLCRRRSSSGALGSVERIMDYPGYGGFGVAIAMDRFGDAIVSWLSYDSSTRKETIQARRRSRDGSLGQVFDISKPGRIGAAPIVGLGEDGHATFAWNVQIGQANESRSFARVLTDRDKLKPIQQLSNGDADASLYGKTVEINGSYLFFWRAFYSGASARIEARIVDASGNLGSIETISNPAEAAFDPDFSVDAQGTTTIAWQSYNGDAYYVQTRTRSSTGALGPIVVVSPTGSYTAKVDVTPEGDAVFAWIVLKTGKFRVQARTRSAAGAWGSVQTLSRPFNNAEVNGVALDRGGHALVSWSDDFDPPTWRYWANAGP